MHIYITANPQLITVCRVVWGRSNYWIKTQWPPLYITGFISLPLNPHRIQHCGTFLQGCEKVLVCLLFIPFIRKISFLSQIHWFLVTNAAPPLLSLSRSHNRRRSIELGRGVQPNTESYSFCESEKLFVCPPRDLDLLQNLIGSVLAHATPFHKVTWKLGQ